MAKKQFLDAVTCKIGAVHRICVVEANGSKPQLAGIEEIAWTSAGAMSLCFQPEPVTKKETGKIVVVSSFIGHTLSALSLSVDEGNVFYFY